LSFVIESFKCANTMPDIDQIDRSFELKFEHMNMDNCLSLPILFDMMQAVAWEHADVNGKGTALLEENKCWILSRIHLKINKLPTIDETIRITTWLKSFTGILVNRDFIGYNEKDEPVFWCTSVWVLIDLKRRRPIRLQGITEGVTFIDNDALPAMIKKMALPVNDHVFETFKVRYSDLDRNQHLNNRNYVKWIIDCHPTNLVKENQIEELQIQFQSESNWGDQVNIVGDLQDGVSTFEGIRTSDEKSIFRSLCKWKKR